MSTEKLINSIDCWIKQIKKELKKFTYANVQMDGRDIDELAEIKEILSEVSRRNSDTDENLVYKIITTVADSVVHDDCYRIDDSLKDQIRKLLGEK